MSSLTHSPADVIRWLLIDLGLGTDPSVSGSWPIHTSSEPDSPDNSISVYDTAGIKDGRIQRTGETREHSGIMLQIRGVTQPIAWAKANAANIILDESIDKSLITISSTDYIVYAVTRHSGPLSLGREPGTNRFLFTINAVVALRQIN